MVAGEAEIQIYRTKRSIVAIAMDRTVDGIWANGASTKACSLTPEAAELGSAALGALEACRLGIPRIMDWKARLNSWLPACGVETNAALMKQSSLVIIKHDPAQRLLVVQPTRNCGANGPGRGYDVRIDGIERIAADASPETLGATILAAFERCTTGAAA